MGGHRPTKHRRRCHRFLLSPLVGEAECLSGASESFLERCFGGALKPMLAHFVEQRRLTRRELTELRQLLDGPADDSPATPKRKSWKP